MNKKELGLSPKEIVQELDKHIIGQNEAKKAVAIALRNRYRRKLVQGDLQEAIVPKNILMIGPTGVGKTEIARRLSKLSASPFIKVEATKFTEVGYVGKEVESIIRDLIEIAVTNFKAHAKKEVKEQSKIMAIERVLSQMVGKNASDETKDKFRTKIESGAFDEREIEIEVTDTAQSASSFDIPGMPGAAMGVLNVGDMLSKALGVQKTKLKKLKVADAINIIIAEEADKLIDEDSLVMQAVQAVENSGIVFLDEIDKIASREGSSSGRGEVSREGVQRDLLPLIEGTVVSTKYGFIRTDHILFIASGAFHLSKPSDLLPELQGRLPIRVELKPLTKEDFVLIMKEPETSLIKQYIALLQTEDIEIKFDDAAIETLADMAESLNRDIENIGARRLHTILEKLLENVSFDVELYRNKEFVITSDYVKEQLGALHKNTDLSKFIL